MDSCGAARRARRLLPLALCLLLAGCRESPVLTETIYRYDAPIVDEETEMLDPGDEGEEDEDFSNLEEDDAETPRDTEKEIGLEEPEPTPTPEPSPTPTSAPTPSTTPAPAQVQYHPNSGNDWQSRQAPEQTSQETGGEAQYSGPAETQGTQPQTEQPVESEEPGAGSEPEPIPGDETAVRQIVDAAGRTVEVPENVGTVTATGSAAQLVELLGGSGRLMGADNAFRSSPLAWSAFSDLGGVNEWWSGSGNSRISESAFAELLEARPDVCFEWSGSNTFSGDQLQRLEEAGISYVVLPALNSGDDLKAAATLIGEVLGATENGTDASAAAAYNAWVDDVFYEVGSRCAGVELSSLYIAGWDDGAAYSLNHSGSLEPNGTGLAYAYSPGKNQMVSAFMRAANVTNESTRVRSLHRDGDYVYVTPMFHQFDPVVSGSRAVFYSGAGEFGAAYDLFVSRQVTQSLYYQLGSAEFPALVVADASVKAQIENNLFWQYRESDSNGFVSVGGESFYRGVGGTYEIYVNPSGLGSWVEGSIDGPLEAYWIACKIAGTMTLDEVKARTADFYSRFLGTVLSEAQLREIFGE